MENLTLDVVKEKFTNYRNILMVQLNGLKKQKVKGKNTKEVITLLQKEYDEICSILSSL